MQTPTSCFSKSEYGDRPKDRSITDADDSTITRPSASSSVVMPTIR